MSRSFEETPASGRIPPLLISWSGPPGGGKTKSALRVAEGMAKVRGGPVVLIDTEAGRALKYKRGIQNQSGHDFIHVSFSPPFKPEDFLEAIKQQIHRNPACIIIDSASDEHVGEGGYLDWHDQEVPKAGGNEWAAWNKPSASRRKLINGIQQINIPMIWTFRAKEKTKQVGRKIQNIGMQPIAPMELVHTMDLSCLIPSRANGVPVWESPKEGEDFVIKLPEFLAPFIKRGAPLDEDLGERLAAWQLGTTPKPREENGGKAKRTPEQMVDNYVAGLANQQSLMDLRDYQTTEATARFIENVRAKHPALYDRIVAANSKRFNELSAAAAPAGEDNPFETGTKQEDIVFDSEAAADD